MTPEQIRTALETAQELPGEALAEAVTQAQALSPDVIALLHKAASGVHLLPRQRNLLFLGLFALAAARRTEACQPFLALLRRPGWHLGHIFGEEVTAFSTELLLGLYDENPEPLFAMLEDRKTASSVRRALFHVLARLSWEGRTPRDRFVALLDRFDREELAAKDDPAWRGWEEAIALLGLKELEPRVRRGWETGRVSSDENADHEEWLAQLNRPAANPQDPSLFVAGKVVPVTDPVASLAWIERRKPAFEDSEGEDIEDEDLVGEDLEDEGLEDEDLEDEDLEDVDLEDVDLEDEDSDALPDPAQRIRLSDSEIRWLDGFFNSDHLALDSLTLEQLDGFFTALAIGPVRVPPSEYFKVVWGGGGHARPDYDSLEQAQFVEDLLSRHWNTIATRLDAMFPPDLLIYPAPLEEKGKGWAEGFTMGIDLRQKEWGPIFKHKDAGTFVWTILALIAEEYDFEAKPITREERAQILAMLPLSLLGIAAFWKNPTSLSRHEPARSEKIGRNQPCPCGSGRKYKKCCGGKAAN
jgi:yecA family protein